MFVHEHPYPPYIPENATKLIVGTLPPPRFSTGDLKPGDVNFCYGSIDGQLWPILDKIFNLNLVFENSEAAILQRKTFLKSRGIGICDIVASAERDKIDASDLGMQNIQLRDLIYYLKQFPKIDTLLFTGGNSKNGPEYFFRKHLKTYNIALRKVEVEVPRIHEFQLEERIIKTVSLTAPSGAANRAVGSMPLYKQLKQRNPEFNTIDFRVMQYREFF
ncbi:uracil-DNA glycosylase family protein [Formosa sp. A9]|uniref:uracil-DNA glycosylase family protein n=1 Tax=Formosa sp. A9 TaxID=3442641 RepID=UPI003EB96417